MAVGKSIRVYLADATVTGIRYAELVNWTGHALACPRNRLSELNNWQEASKPGVYFLFEGRFGDGKPLAYIGESENVLQRLVSHDRKKDFWNEVVVFTSKDENLTKAHIKYLESLLVSMSKAADRYQFDNINTPVESSLPRADRDAMVEFVENIRMVLGILGYQILEPLLPSSAASQSNIERPLASEANPDVVELTFNVNGHHASGVVTDEGFVLKKGSQLSLINSMSVPGRVSLIKERLMTDGLLVPEENRLVATADILLSSSTYAAALVAGTSRSGPQSWKLADGRSLKELEEATEQALSAALDQQ